jgi:hypothetical protein
MDLCEIRELAEDLEVVRHLCHAPRPSGRSYSTAIVTRVGCSPVK